ncbi:MAG: neutral/alkaline non-lysosomal ceramidase N-terminal domain-containing protein [Gemmataceae bacterium]
MIPSLWSSLSIHATRSRLGFLVSLVLASAGTLPAPTVASAENAHAPQLKVGFAETDITPQVKQRTVYMAGFGKGRVATGVHDPLMVRAVVFQHNNEKIAMVSVDVVGLFYEFTQKIRTRLPGYKYVLVSATHNHEGPDTMGLWGPNPFLSGIDQKYMSHLQNQVVKAVQSAAKNLRSANTRLGKHRAPELLHDSRKPLVKHDEIVVLQFLQPKSSQSIGILVQWNCHPEVLGGSNKLITADHVGYTVAYLKRKYKCPVAYFTGTVGGLMTNLRVPVRDKNGKLLKDRTFQKAERYGNLVGEAADTALKESLPVKLYPFDVRQKQIYLPIANEVYLLGWKLGVLRRKAYKWNGNIEKAKELPRRNTSVKNLCLRTEVGYIRLGELGVAAIPGEIYPELVLGKYQDPVEPGADYPKSKLEPSIYSQFSTKHKMIIGLANDEIGYIIPKRQWDQKPPYCYGRKRSQYGEINSLGSETAPLLCDAFCELLRKRKTKKIHPN